MGLAAWFGTSAVRVINPIELVIVGLLIALGFFTAWRFHTNRGWIAGTVLMIALIVEVSKRIILTTQGSADFGVVDTIIVVAISIGLLMGIRTARAMRDAGAVGRDGALL